MISILGLDPGQSGGLAIVSSNGAATCWKLDGLTERDIWDSINSAVGEYDVVQAVIERVGATPQMGVTSAFTFGKGYGMLRGFLIEREVSMVETAPTVWQREFSLPSKRACDDSITVKKNAHKARAQELFPTLKVTHSVADALLLAEWGMRRYKQSGRQDDPSGPVAIEAVAG